MKSQLFTYGGGAGIGSYIIVMKDGELQNPNAEKIRWSYDSGENLFLSIIDDTTEEALLPLSGYVGLDGNLHLSGRDFDDNKTYEFTIENDTQSVVVETIDGITMGEGTIPTEGGGGETPFEWTTTVESQESETKFWLAIDNRTFEEIAEKQPIKINLTVRAPGREEEYIEEEYPLVYKELVPMGVRYNTHAEGMLVYVTLDMDPESGEPRALFEIQANNMGDNPVLGTIHRSQSDGDWFEVDNADLTFDEVYQIVSPHEFGKFLYTDDDNPQDWSFLDCTIECYNNNEIVLLTPFGLIMITPDAGEVLFNWSNFHSPFASGGGSSDSSIPVLSDYFWVMNGYIARLFDAHDDPVTSMDSFPDEFNSPTGCYVGVGFGTDGKLYRCIRIKPGYYALTREDDSIIIRCEVEEESDVLTCYAYFCTEEEFFNYNENFVVLSACTDQGNGSMMYEKAYLSRDSMIQSLNLHAFANGGEEPIIDQNGDSVDVLSVSSSYIVLNSAFEPEVTVIALQTNNGR